ncbi:MAG: thioesterase [Sneathiella sp.]|uniref:acyl-CoA thioesterase n=1 Tax=Sneathiella sp. TaxID=1964365 RepID=UPI000C46A436|nr:acyl-CoA thioesterase [Sneathiella sp.]MAL78002.1 thioesterase [Sneathiella sp.]|tara:strand:- start:181 stop:588 length:408 start_codon:yes stop_codon:yes gene_type:complete
MIAAEVTVKCQFYDLDPMGIVWHGNYPRFFELARCALLDKLDYNYQQMSDSGYAWPIVDMRIKYIRSIRFAEEVRVRAILAEYENRLKINYEINHRDTGEKITRGYTIQVAVDQRTEEMLFQSPPVLYDKVGSLL